MAKALEKMTLGSATVPVNPPRLIITSLITALDLRNKSNQNSSWAKSANFRAKRS